MFTLRSVVIEATGATGIVLDRYKLRAVSLDQAMTEADGWRVPANHIAPNGLEIEHKGSILARRRFISGSFYVPWQRLDAGSR